MALLDLTFRMVVTDVTEQNSTEQRLIELATEVLQTSGYHALRFGTLAEELGITKASVHYHFPNKVDLGKRSIQAYRRQMQAELLEIDRDTTDPFDALDRYIDLYKAVLDGNGQRMCPGGMLAAETVTLPKEIRDETVAYLHENATWLTKLVLNARAEPKPTVEEAQAEAEQILCALQGALLLARLFDDPGRLDSIRPRLIEALKR